MNTTLNLVTIISCIYFCQCYNILVVMPASGRSHFHFLEPLLKALTVRNHNLTVVSFFQHKEKLQNYREVLITTNTTNFTGVGLLDLTQFQNTKYEMYKNGNFLAYLSEAVCQVLLSNPKVRGILKENNRFDLVIVELFHTNCHLGFARAFATPMIGKLSSSTKY